MFGQQNLHKINVLQTSMSDWKIELFAYNNHLESMSMKRGIFLKINSTLLFLTPFSMVLRMLESGYRLVEGKHEIAVSHLLFKDDLRLRFTCSRFKYVVPAMKKGRTWTAVVLISQ